MLRQAWFTAAFLLVGMPACEANVDLDSPYGMGGGATTTTTTVATSGGGSACIPIDDGRPCVLNTCEDGVPGQVNVAQGTPCGVDLFCDGQGKCIGCYTAKDCPGENSDCQKRLCEGSICGVYFITEGKPLAVQAAHDCVKLVCDGSGGTKAVADDTDLPKDDGDLCSDDVCVMGVPSHPVKADGAWCSDHDGCTQTDSCASGICVGDNPVLCPGGASCVAGACPCTGTVGLPAAPLLKADAKAVASADLDGDGTMDLAVLSGDVSVFLNQGGAAFAPSVDYDLGGVGIASAIAAADITGDGMPDIMTLTSNPDVLNVLINNGDGTFNLAATYPQNHGYLTIEATDLNGDGRADLIVYEWWGAVVSVMLNYGDGSFAPRVDYAGPFAQAATAVDLNLDGSPDLVMVGVDSAGIAMNNGDGTFGPIIVYSLPGDWIGIAAADLNADGISDIVALNWITEAANIFLNDGSGTLGSGVAHGVGLFAPGAPVVADLTGDGVLDVALGTYAGPQDALTVLVGDGLGGFAPKVDYPTAFPFGVVASDLDSDGDLDLAAALPSRGVNLLTNLGNGTFPQFSVYATTHSPYSVKALDLSGDDVPDLLWTSGSLDTIGVALNQGDGVFGMESTYPGGTTAVTATDVDGDAKRDLVSIGFEDSTLRVRLNDGAGTFGPAVDYPTGLGPLAVAFLDANGDSHSDLATANSDAGSVSVFLNKGDGTFADKVDYPAAAPLDVAAADLNGDGYSDLVTICPGSSSVSVLANDGTGAFGEPVDWDLSGTAHAIVLADFDGDGAMDVAVRAGAAVGILINQGAFSFAPAVYYPTGASYDIEATDLNSDGFPDLVLSRDPDHGSTALLNQGDGTFSDWVQYPLGTDAGIASADLNGDGRPDLIMTNRHDHTLSVLFNVCLP